MAWNFRVIETIDQDGEKYRAIHEVYYDDDGEIRSYSTNPIAVTSSDGESNNGLSLMLEKMGQALLRPVIRFEDLPGQ